MLLTTDKPVSSIGYENGYLNNASFARAFSRRFGVSAVRLSRLRGRGMSALVQIGRAAGGSLVQQAMEAVSGHIRDAAASGRRHACPARPISPPASASAGR